MDDGWRSLIYLSVHPWLRIRQLSGVIISFMSSTSSFFPLLFLWQHLFILICFLHVHLCFFPYQTYWLSQSFFFCLVYRGICYWHKYVLYKAYHRNWSSSRTCQKFGASAESITNAGLLVRFEAMAGFVVGVGAVAGFVEFSSDLGIISPWGHVKQGLVGMCQLTAVSCSDLCLSRIVRAAAYHLQIFY